jgi:protein farnesyltransferase/geranylgeranyltransferase type-1 subunit alpha
MGKYAESTDWADISPIPQDDGLPHTASLASIKYTEEYSEAMSYLRAVMAKNEFSDRVLALTEDVVWLNPAHYTVWLYRAKCLFELKKDLRKELEWLDGVALKNLKNYQIW